MAAVDLRFLEPARDGLAQLASCFTRSSRAASSAERWRAHVQSAQEPLSALGRRDSAPVADGIEHVALGHAGRRLPLPDTLAGSELVLGEHAADGRRRHRCAARPRRRSPAPLGGLGRRASAARRGRAGRRRLAAFGDLAEQRADDRRVSPSSATISPACRRPAAGLRRVTLSVSSSTSGSSTLDGFAGLLRTTWRRWPR